MTAERQEYLDRMSTCPPFVRLGLTPEWMPGEQDIEGFVHDEVVRQYHDPRVRHDGGIRIEWMQSAWAYALEEQGRPPNLGDVLALGHLVERDNSLYGFRQVEVSIAGQMGAPSYEVPYLLAALFMKVDKIQPRQGRESGASPADYRRDWKRFPELLKGLTTADDFYLAYESVHPLGDGNGRTGKIFHNWLLGTLEDPVLVRDYFGGGNP